MLLALKPAAARIGVHPDTLKGWSGEGRGPAFTRTEGGHRRYDTAEIDRYLAASDQRVPSPA